MSFWELITCTIRRINQITVNNEIPNYIFYYFMNSKILFYLVTMKAVNFVNHPDYDPSKIANDVALIELPQEVQYNGNTNGLVMSSS